MRIRHVLPVIALIGATATAASFAGAYGWGFEILSHFRPQLALGGLVLFLLGALARSAPACLIALGFAIANAPPLWSYEMARPIPAPAQGQAFRLMFVNLHGGATTTAAFRRLADLELPDILVLTELAPSSLGLMRSLAGNLPHLSFDNAGSPFDVAILSRWPLRDVVVDRSVHPRLPVTRAIVCPVADPCLTLIALHAARPIMTPKNAAQRDAQLQIAQAWARQSAGRAVLVGDLNLTPWSPTFAELSVQGRLVDSAFGRGVPSTWPVVLGPFGIALDHILVGERIGVRDRRGTLAIGSDHRPIVADLVLR